MKSTKNTFAVIKIIKLAAIAITLASCSKSSNDEQTPVANIDIKGIVTTFAGSITGDADGTGTYALFDLPGGICNDAQGNLYVADTDNYKIKKITPAGVVTTLAGSTKGDSEGTGANAKFTVPFGICIDTQGNLYVTDINNYKIKKITPLGVVTNFAGSTSGDKEGTGANAKFSFLRGICIDKQDNLYVTDNNKIKKITPAGVVTNFAGSTNGDAEGTGGSAKFSVVLGICIDQQGNLYVADSNKIKKITPAGVVTNFAGSTNGDYGDFDATGVNAKFNNPFGICIDTQDNLYVVDLYNYKIKKISATGAVSTLAGSAKGYADGIGASAMFNTAYFICFYNNKLYVADTYNNKIRMIE